MEQRLYWEDTTFGAEMRWGAVNKRGAIKGSIRVAEIKRNASKVGRPVEFVVTMAATFSDSVSAKVDPFFDMDSAKSFVHGRVTSVLSHLLLGLDEAGLT